MNSAASDAIFPVDWQSRSQTGETLHRPMIDDVSTPCETDAAPRLVVGGEQRGNQYVFLFPRSMLGPK